MNSVALFKQKLKANVDGRFFVDSTCINCSTCRMIAPTVFDEADGYSFVFHQPEGNGELLRGQMAIISCPTASIGSSVKENMNEAVNSFPDLITENIYHCGFHSKKSFGATSYLIKREGGNIMVDSPRYVKSLATSLEKMGGIKYLFLTHKDDVADHQKFADHFGCERILHKGDLSESLETVEIVIDGEDEIDFGEGLKFIPVPGHTEGSACLLYKNYLFTGDHLAQNNHRPHPTAFSRHCWYSWSEQIKSMKKTALYDFEWILPGHSRICFYQLPEMKKKMQECINWMESL